jgi:hypothetical protein
MTRIVVALAAGIGGFLLAAPAQAQAPSSPSTPTTGAPIMTAGPVMSGDVYTGPTRRGLFGRLRSRNTNSGPMYNMPYPGNGAVINTPTTTAPPLRMPATGTPSTTPSSQPVGDPAALPAPRTAPGTITSSSFYPPGTTIAPNGRVILPPGTTVVNGQVVPASGTMVAPDGTVIPASYSMPSDYGPSQPVRRGLFGRLRYR